MNVLVIGSGGREHALCWALRASPLCGRLWCAPGNAGIAELAECIADFHAALAAPFAAFLAAPETDFEGMARFCRENAVDLVVVGPEAPLAAGIFDELTAEGIRVFGPTRAAAQLESSKGFAKDICARYGIPTAPYKKFTDAEAARAYIRAQGAPIVVKADGLAAGKGVVVAQTVEEAEQSVDAMLGGAPGEAGGGVVVEAFLEGEEASFFALSDGENVLPLATAQDYKRAYDGDTGPNTGGMGACSPAPVMTEAMVSRVLDEIVRPTIAAMQQEGVPYQGVIYAGLMITADGPKLIEYNVRFGDPEAQVLMMRLRDDLLVLLRAAVDGQLGHMTVRWRSEAALTVVMATRGYPGSYENGSEIRGVEEAAAMQDVEVFHGGTVREDGVLKAAGGRVLNVTALGRDLCEAQARAYAAIDLIDWPDGFCRRDIGWRSVSREMSVK